MARSWWIPNLSARHGLFLPLIAMLLPGCVLSGISFGNELPDVASVMAIEPGRTTCEQVLDLLGPPEEYAQPTPYLGLRAWDAQEQRVLVERDILSRRTWTWIRERRTDHMILIPFLFTWLEADHRADRIVVIFDDRGIVTAVGSDQGRRTP